MPGLHYEAVVRAQVANAEVVLVHSQHAYDEAKTVCDESKLIVLGNGVDPIRFHPGIRQRDASARPLRALTVGLVSFRKGMPTACAAALLARDAIADLRLAGPLSGGPAGIAADLPSDPRIKLLGEVHSLDLPDLYRSSDVFVFPTLSETLARALLEAMASGLPVITTPASGGGHVIDDGVEGFLVPPGRPDIVADRLKRLHADPALRVRMGEAARARVAPLTWDALGERVADAVIERVPDLNGASLG